MEEAKKRISETEWISGAVRYEAERIFKFHDEIVRILKERIRELEAGDVSGESC